ncbi:S8 family serine peptidase [Rhizobium sp.]
MTAIRKALTATMAALLALSVASFDLGPGLTPVIGKAYADDDGGGRGGRNGQSRSRNQDGDGYDDDRRRPTLFQVFRKQRPRVRRKVRTEVRQQTHEPDMLITSGISDGTMRILLAAGYAIVERHAVSSGDVVKLKVPRRMALDQARQAVQAAAPAALVDLNHYYRPDSDDGCDGNRCFVRHIAGWPVASEPLGCQPDRPIGLIDTQINTRHPSLADSGITSIPLVEGEQDRSEAKHGTAVAALLVGKGEVTGLLPGWELIAVDAFKKGDIATGMDLVRAIDILAQRNVGVINMSLSGPDNVLLRRTIAETAKRDIVLIAAAGNDGPRAKPLFPAAYDNVIAVTAVDRSKRVYRRAAQGDHIDIAAPGVNVWTAASVSGQRPRNGTSFAAPFVAAAAALIKADNPGFSADEVRIVLENEADDLGDPGRDNVFGWGLVDIRSLCRS